MRPLLGVCLVAACYTSTSVAPPPPSPPREPLVLAPPAPARDGEIYALDEAVADALSGPLHHIGTGPWHGLFRIHACAYRNDRVIVVNMYCTPKEMKAFGVVVLSATRGRAYIYAEAERPISELARGDYFTFKGEAYPPPPDPAVPPVSLRWSYEQLNEWDERRYRKHYDGCWGGIEIHNPQGGCLRGLKAHAPAWKQRNQPFLDQPPRDWYRLVHELRVRARRDGKHVANAGG